MLAVDEVRRAVDRIDQPAMFAVGTFDGREFLAGQAPGILAEQALADQRFGLLVGVRDEIARPLDADLDIAKPLEMLERQGAGLAGGFDHVIEDLAVIDCHELNALANPSGSSVVIWSTLSLSRRST
ncbi:hypothetical protein D3C71_1352290 [compost metagenome]